MSLGKTTLAVVTLCVLTSMTASAQDTAPTVDLRSRWGAQIGLALYKTGTSQCSEGDGFTFGAEARTRGVWFGAVGVDLFYAGVGLCLTFLRQAYYGGELVDFDGSSSLSGALRPRIRLGRTVTVGKSYIEPALGIGMIHSEGAIGYPQDRVWNAWLGGTLTLSQSDFPFGFELEYGLHQVRQRYTDSQSGQVVRDFSRWGPLLRFSLVR